jgi:hypothetical protein
MAPGGVKWVSYVDDGVEYAAAYLDDRLVRYDAAGWWVADANGGRTRLSGEDLAKLRGTSPDQPSVWPEQSLLAASRNGAARQLAGDSHEPTMFQRYGAAELAAMDTTFRWIVRGVVVKPTYGQLAGEQKTLKTYLSLMLYLSIASGRPFLDRFEVDESGPVVAYVGEGGRAPYTRRLLRVARAMKVDLDSVPLWLSFDVAPIQSALFQESLQRDLDELEPALVGLDPLYAYHGTAIKASDLHQEGSLLSSLSSRCGAGGASLLVNNHFNQTGAGGGLSRITQAGSGEWVDTWLLVSHRDKPDVANGHFRLALDIGSRQWGGTTWDVDLEVGRFEADAGEFIGDIAWSCRRHQESDHDGRVVEIVTGRPWEFTKEDVASIVGGRASDARLAVDRALAAGQITTAKVSRTRSDGRPYKVLALGPPSELGTVGTVDGASDA